MTARTFSSLKTLFQGRDPQDWVDDLVDSIKGGGFVPIPLTALREVVGNNIWRPVGSGNEIGTIQVPLTALSEIVSNNIWRPIGSGNEIGTIQVPLTAVREVASNNIPDAAGIGGILASDTTPILQFTNGDTDSALRLNYAATVVDPITFQVVLPDDLDEGQNIVINVRAAMSNTNDTPTLTAETFFNEGDTKVSDASAAVTGATVADYAITIAAADVPSGARTMSVELTPGAHGTDILYVYGIWVEYSILATPALGYTNGDTDSAAIRFGDFNTAIFNSLTTRCHTVVDKLVHFAGIFRGDVLCYVESVDRATKTNRKIGYIEVGDGLYAALAGKNISPGRGYSMAHGRNHT